MKALMIATEKLPVPPIRGGAIQTYIANVAGRLAQSGIELTVLSVADPDLPNDERRDGVRFVRVKGGTLDRYRESVVDFLGKERFDRIHLFNRPKLVLPVSKAAPDTPLSLSLHNEMFLPRKIDPAEARLAIAAVDRIATVSDFIGKGISDPYPEAASKLRTIYSGVDAGEFVPGWTSQGRAMRDSLRREHGLAGKQVVLFVGRLSPKKGADILLRAMEFVAKVVPSAALVLVGSKWYGADEMTDYVTYLKHLSARSSIPVVTTGFITPDQVNQWFAAGDLFVCPSVWQEPLARVHYEAMASGLPIITTRRGGNPEVVEKTGVGVVVDDPESPEPLAKAILGLLKNPSRREAMGQAGRRLAMERFNWDRVAREIAALWAEAPTTVQGAEALDLGSTPSASEARPEATRVEPKERESTRYVEKRTGFIRPAERIAASAGRTTAPTRAAVRASDPAREAERVSLPDGAERPSTELIRALEQPEESTRPAETSTEPVRATEQMAESPRTADQREDLASTAERTIEPVRAAAGMAELTERVETMTESTKRGRAEEATPSEAEKDRPMIGRDLYQMGRSLWVSKRALPMGEESRSAKT